ncbi:GGDEF domain-containing protein [Andreprevotia chitinilytica]|uniref:GGDEF domain-containing protein n=1 Tax=Andreprevotia chitinilytica TaxID=396808 RepID=UPI000552E45A|nr:GGDEF domain-containing protein [Andreprevotia chitinilytica]
MKLALSDTALDQELLYKLLDALQLGVMLLDASQHIVVWNSWLARTSGRPADQILGQRFADTFPALSDGRLMHAIEQALQRRLPAILSQSLNPAPFDLYAQGQEASPASRIKQAIQILPLSDAAGQRYVLLQIQDVTAAVLREQLLVERAEELRRHSYVDGLTGVANRRRFDEQLLEEWRRAGRAKRPLGLLLIDIDHFKRYNDRFGHQVGDINLRLVAQTLAAAVPRTDDLIARYGGEEFVALLPNTDLDGCMQVGQNLLEAVAKLRLPHPESPHGIVTVSIGVAAMRDEEQQDASTLILAADLGMYLAKQRGRNQIGTAD